MARSTAGRGADQFPLRLPDGMRDRIKAAADARGLSMNTVIIDALEERFPPAPTIGELAEMTREIALAAKMMPRDKVQLEILLETLQHLISTIYLERGEALPEPGDDRDLMLQALKPTIPDATPGQLALILDRLLPLVRRQEARTKARLEPGPILVNKAVRIDPSAPPTKKGRPK